MTIDHAKAAQMLIDWLDNSERSAKELHDIVEQIRTNPTVYNMLLALMRECRSKRRTQ
jgi:hypothetical protein